MREKAIGSGWGEAAVAGERPDRATRGGFLRIAARAWLRGWLAFPARAMLDRPYMRRAGRTGYRGDGPAGSQGGGGVPVRFAAVALGFAAIYVIWGSTYQAIAWGVESLPPLLMMGVRFLAAGGVLYAWARLRGVAAPGGAEWKAALVIGALLFLVTHGLLAWAEQRIASGLAALLGATVPLWMVLLEWARRGGVRPSGRVLAGVAAGLAGVAVLALPGAGRERMDLVASAAVLVGAFAWSAGSIYARGARLPRSHALAAGMQLLAGGVLLVAAGVAFGEPGRFDFSAATVRSVLALAYLTVFGSLVAYSAYFWLLRVTTPARVATHAFVNPAVAVALGSLAGETLAPGMLLAGALILLAVIWITFPGRARVARRPGRESRPLRSRARHWPVDFGAYRSCSSGQPRSRA
jgi:drug/metabolite transporter (DMT)-like permease